MTRSPLFYPLNRGMDAEAGGVADLQTDVMRFIAILALCLVAIFALVQSIPLMPTFEAPDMIVQAPPDEKIDEPVSAELPEPVVVEPEPPPAEEKPLIITRPAPQRMPVKRTPERIIERTIAARTTETVEPQPADSPAREVSEPVVDEATPPARSEGFTLRFETDLALTRLVARNEVGLYAIAPEKSLRMNVNRGSLSFWPASMPNQFHEMDEGTVPADVLSALRRAGSVKTSDVKWGVTLPRKMRGELDQILRQHRGGSLIIAGDGSLRREP